MYDNDLKDFSPGLDRQLDFRANVFSMCSNFKSPGLVGLLIASLLVSQVLCVSHTHASHGDPSEHDARPHVHIGAMHSHTHGVSHSHAHAHSSKATDRSVKYVLACVSPSGDHEADAFYLCKEFGRRGSSDSSGLGAEDGKQVRQSVAAFNPLITNPVAARFNLHPPPEPASTACALYLLHLSIRC